LLKKGFREIAKKKRDHEYFFFFHEGKKTNILTKISHGAREIGDPNCSAMAKQMRLSNPQFNEFVGCSLELTHYLKILTDGHYIQ